MSDPPSRLVCSGCGSSPAPDEPYPFRCAEHATGDVDHVVTRVLEAASVRFPVPEDGEGNPFVRYRGLLHSYHRAVAGGVSDGEFVSLVRRIDEEIAAVDGHGFAVTPLERSEVLSKRLGFSAGGGVWVKDETGNVSGSHKARHLMGVLLHLEVAEMLGLADRRGRPDLAIASCGNAALAAAVVAAAGKRRLRVFVPVDADARILKRLEALGAEVTVCPREPGVAGDPTYARLLEELEKGALPFTCQGNLNGLAIEGGETLGYEVVSGLAAAGVELDDLVVQVGGGALASSCAQSLSEAATLGALPRPPRVHTVQTAGAHPLERAYRKVNAELPASPSAGQVDRALHHAATHRSEYMWAWESEPKSVATGILDDETYDWLAVLRGMLTTGGRPVIAGEGQLVEAHTLGREAGYLVDPTGSSGLAALIDLRASGLVGPAGRAAVLFTGRER